MDRPRRVVSDLALAAMQGELAIYGAAQDTDMLRLTKYVAVMLVVTFVVLWVVRERFLKGAGVFLDEFVEGVVPWVLIVAICHGFFVLRRRTKLARRSRQSAPTVR